MNVQTIPYAPPVVNRHTPPAVVASRLKVKQASGQLLNFDGFNFGPEQYIQIHEGGDIDGTTGPANGDVPIFVFRVPASAAFSFDRSFKFEGGLWLCNSSTRDTLTAGAADCSWLANEI